MIRPVALASLLLLAGCHVAPMVAISFGVGLLDHAIGITDGVLAMVRPTTGTVAAPVATGEALDGVRQ